VNKLISGALLAALFLSGCQTVPLPTKKGFGNIYGTVTARSHKAIIAKAEAAKNAYAAGPYETRRAGGTDYSDTRMNYEKLDEIYVGVIGASPERGTVHAVKAGHAGFEPGSLALSTGDVLRVTNITSHPLTIYLAATTSDAFDELPVLAPGASGEITVGSSGDFELGADEGDHLPAMILARPGMAVKRVSSGSSYTFENLKPGDYRMLFWYWRLGAMESDVTVIADKAVNKSETLAVDTLVR